MRIKYVFSASNNLIELFNKKNYEQYVLDLMNLSKTVFPNTYSMVDDQSAGQCDYIDSAANEKYDAKLPFLSEQIKLLTDGIKHKPEILEWIKEMHDEAAQFSPHSIRDDPHHIESTRLYNIMRNQILRDKKDENIIFFLPYPISLSFKDSMFLQSTSDYISLIFEKLKTKIDLIDRFIYTIYPSAEKNTFVLRCSNNSYYREYIYYDKMEKFFSYEVVDVDVSQ